MPGLVDLPRSLALDRRVKDKAKYLYVAIQLNRPSSISELAEETGMNYSLVSKLCSHLCKYGWIVKIKRQHTVIPLLGVPETIQNEMIRQLHVEYDMASFKGEFLMKKFLDFLIASTDYIDNARPGFLQNPDTGEPLEYDRYYPSSNVAFEFQGQQHYGPTAAFSNTDEFKKRRTRDIMKMGLSIEQNVTLIHVTPEDLSIARLSSKIPPSLPKAYVDATWPYAIELELAGKRYSTGLSRTITKERNRERAERI